MFLNLNPINCFLGQKSAKKAKLMTRFHKKDRTLLLKQKLTMDVACRKRIVGHSVIQPTSDPATHPSNQVRQV